MVERMLCTGIDTLLLHFFFCLSKEKLSCKFGRVVKALALGANLERGTGSNPVTWTFVFVPKKRFCRDLNPDYKDQNLGC